MSDIKVGLRKELLSLKGIEVKQQMSYLFIYSDVLNLFQIAIQEKYMIN